MAHPDDPTNTRVDTDKLPEVGPADTHYYLAKSLMHEGIGFPEISQRLTGVGLRDEFTTMVVTDTAIHLIEPLVLSDVAADRILMRLTSRGMDDAQAANILAEARLRHGKRLKLSGIKSGPFYILGAAVMLVGAVVCIFSGELGIVIITLGAFIAGFTAWFLR